LAAVHDGWVGEYQVGFRDSANTGNIEKTHIHLSQLGMKNRTPRLLRRLAEPRCWVVMLACVVCQCLGTPAVASAWSSSDETRATDLQEVKNLTRQHRWGEAATEIEALLKKHPTDPQILYLQGVVRFKRADNIGAIMAFRSAERQGLNTEELHKSLGLAYWQIHQYSLFERQMKRAIQINPSDYEPYYALARHLQSINESCTQAEELLAKAIQLKPDEPKIIFSLGVCQEMSGHRADAMSTYVKAMQMVEAKHEKYSWPFQEMARLLLAQDPEQALKLAQRAVELAPDLDAAHQILAKVEDVMGNYPQAISDLLSAARLDPSNPSPHYALFLIYTKTRDPEAARAQLKEFEELNALYAQR
jgi:Flp pilus assembly protein TadD